MTGQYRAIALRNSCREIAEIFAEPPGGGYRRDRSWDGSRPSADGDDVQARIQPRWLRSVRPLAHARETGWIVRPSNIGLMWED